jgi:hypothetical protein
MSNNQELRDRLSRNGKVLTPHQRQQIADSQQAAVTAVVQQYQASKPQPKTIELNRIDRILVNVPGFVRIISDIGNTLTTVTQSMIPASLPLLLVGLIFAEAERVRYGVALFETHSYLTYLVAYILVIGNAFVELAIQHRHNQAGYIRGTGQQFSLRILLSRIGYLVGFGEQWQPLPKSPAVRLERLQWTLTAAILFLAISGSMTDTIRQADGNWREGIRSIAVDSTLLELMTWTSGLVSAVVIVLLTQIIVAYAYGRASEYFGELVARKDNASGQLDPAIDGWQHELDQAIQATRDQVEREYLLRAISKTEGSTHPKDLTTISQQNGRH